MDADVPLSLRTMLQPNTGAGTSGSFLGLGSDNARYWIKPLNNRQSPRVCFTEVVLSRLGQLIGAPVCSVVLMRITEDFAGVEFEPHGTKLEPGVAAASRHISGAVEYRDLRHRGRDSNDRRHAGVLALFLWLGGYDHQWLYVGSNDEELWSHDHGHYLCGGHDWNALTLTAGLTGASNVAALGSHLGLHIGEVLRLADALDDLDADTIAASVCRVPGAWPIPAADKIALCQYVDVRRTMASAQLRQVAQAL